MLFRSLRSQAIYKIAILLVSHDRYLVDRLATQIWNLEAGHLQVFDGSYQEFLATQTLEAQPQR